MSIGEAQPWSANHVGTYRPSCEVLESGKLPGRPNRMMALANPIKHNALDRTECRECVVAGAGKESGIIAHSSRRCFLHGSDGDEDDDDEGPGRGTHSGHPEFILCNFQGHSSSRSSRSCPYSVPTTSSVLLIYDFRFPRITSSTGAPSVCSLHGTMCMAMAVRWADWSEAST